MPGWPSGKFYRKTQHAKPRYQLYQPGFNSANGCWLDGAWITVPKDDWDRRKDDHDRTYSAARKQVSSQHYRDDGVAVEAMTPAQKQAWEFYSGSLHVTAHEPGGAVGLVGVETAGRTLTVSSQKWLRREGYRLLRWVKAPGPEGGPVDQLEGLEVPEDLVSESLGRESASPVDTWKHIVERNVANFDAMFESMVKMIEGTTLDGVAPPVEYASMMAFHRIIEIEETIVRMEWRVSRGEEADPYQTIEGETARYVKLRARLKKAVEHGGEGGGGGSFEGLLKNARATHNECERANLDNSDGCLFAFVLPEFREDGSHDPWGPRDVPWAQETQEVSA